MDVETGTAGGKERHKCQGVITVSRNLGALVSDEHTVGTAGDAL